MHWKHWNRICWFNKQVGPIGNKSAIENWFLVTFTTTTKWASFKKTKTKAARNAHRWWVISLHLVGGFLPRLAYTRCCRGALKREREKETQKRIYLFVFKLFRVRGLYAGASTCLIFIIVASLSTFFFLYRPAKQRKCNSQWCNI